MTGENSGFHYRSGCNPQPNFNRVLRPAIFLRTERFLLQFNSRPAFKPEPSAQQQAAETSNANSERTNKGEEGNPEG